MRREDINVDDRFVSCDRDTPLLFPPDLRDWVPEDDFVHFVVEVVNEVRMDSFRTKRTRSGSKQYNPRMMLGLLIYCYSQGTFPSRKIERATYRDVGVRFLTANEHPDHDTICKFRRENAGAIAEAFIEALRLGREAGMLKVGTVSVDGTLIDANASKYKTVDYGRICELEKQLEADVDELMKRAEQADREDENDGQSLPDELTGRKKLKSKLAEARARLERQAKERADAERPVYEEKLRKRERNRAGGRAPKPPSERPSDTDRINLTDPDAKLMRKSQKSAWRQAYNCQATVDADGSQLVLANHVSTCSSDNNELEPALHGVPAEVGTPTAVLADTGYVNADAFDRLGEEGYDLYVAVSRLESHRDRTYDFRTKVSTSSKVVRDPRLLEMKAKLKTPAAREKYKRRTSTVEPVFGIIKRVLGFRQFSLRGLSKVALEWDLVCLTYNLKRLFNLKNA